jgi:enoyl-CoA hydratase
MGSPDVSYETILTERRGRVLLVTLNRPKALNALNTQLSHELIDALTQADSDDGVDCTVITGSEKAFAAGADIKEMQGRSYMDMHGTDFFGQWDKLATLRKPTLAAVSGFALGGGCELAMMCDFILCSDTAKFGQPEIKLGVMPGMGGSQRLTRLVGQAKAMEMCMTGRMMGAEEAERSGLVSRIVPAAELLAEALETADTIANMPLPALLSIRDSIRRAQELPLTEGVRFERRIFHALFATHDQKEGMAAFVEKRPPDFTHR